ncbi:hemagglutinin repeat-containing protein [Burkholderia dolosa]|uniref:hemagglutinin repeat-containing protein n=1 Tax=Burkholderia dolosa TaxID=152500 RepID=UPI001B990117|nr:hemagglutinin repeat-containing protein [Burkholderia dolosa]MBR8302342.1 hemagglutinin repeat-containing protein [Burkholderia dolosa]
MNKSRYRVVFNRARCALMVVQENGQAPRAAGSRCAANTSAVSTVLHTAWHPIAWVAMLLLGAPAVSMAQIVPTPGTTTQVIQTPNGLPQVNVAKPSSAGVSVNTYNQFDVQRAGAILNNSATMVQTQQAGWINGNPNFGAGQAARIIVNQINSPNPSQIRGAVEIAGARAEVVLANPSGIFVDGGTFLNTSRATLTTGVPYYGADGSLAGYNVNRGLVTVAGAGLNATGTDQVDLIARAVQMNASVYAKNLNVIAGAAQVNHDTLAATPIAGDGPAPSVAIDVSQLGGMYSDRIFLASNEFGVGVANAGTIAAQAGDLTLQSNGRLVLTGKTTASGSLAMSAAGGVQNSGTTYAQQSASVNTGADLTNSGTLAAQQNVGVNAGSVNSTGTLGAGVNNDGSVARSGELSVTASGTLNATGQTVAGGNATLTGSSVNLAGSQTAANGNLSLNANTGDLNLAGATTSAQGAINANVAGALVNDHGSLSSGSSATLAAASISNQGGAVSSQGPLVVQASGQIANQAGSMVSQGAMQVRGGAIANNQGTLQSAAGMAVSGAALDNRAGRITSLSSDGLTVAVTNQLTNAAGTTATGAQGGVIGGNGDVDVQGGTVVNHGAMSAQANLHVIGQSIDNSSGSLQAGQSAVVDAGSHFVNSNGTVVANQAATVNATTLDNSAGTTQAAQLSLNATDLVNHGGTLTQTGTGPMAVNVGGTLDNSAGGTLQTNSTDLTLAPAALVNDGGAITHAGTGTLTVKPGQGTGAIGNVGGQIVSAGHVIANAGSLNNAQGVLAAKNGIVATIAGDLNNSHGQLRSLTSLSLNNGGALANTNGRIQSGTGNTNDTSTLDIQSASIENSGGLIGNLDSGTTTVQAGSQLVNSNGTVTGNGDTSVLASSIVNTQGGQLSGTNLHVRGDALDNSGGTIGNVGNGDVDVTTTGAIVNTNGRIGSNHDLSVNANTLTGGGTYSAANDAALTLQGNFTATPDFQFSAGHDLAFTLPGTFTNGTALQAVHNLSVDAGDIVNSGAIMAGNLLRTHSNTLTNTGAMVGGSASLVADSTLTNVGPTALIGASDSNGTLELLSRDIENRDDTTATDTQAQTAIFGLGKVVLAGGKDASGNYTNAALIRNQSALIQSGGDMELHADKITNTRRVMTTTGYTNNVDPAVLAAQGISLSGCASYFAVNCEGGGQMIAGLRSDNITPEQTAALIKQPGGMYIEPPHGGQWNSGYFYTTYTGVASANMIKDISPAGQIVSGGNIDATSSGLLQNYWSNIAAVGNVKLPAQYDADGWKASGQEAPGVIVTYSGQYHYNNYDNSEHDWQLPFGNEPFVTSRPGGYTQKAPADVRTYKLPDYQSTLVSNGTISGTGVSINNTAENASIPSLGLLPGQSLGGVNLGGVNGKPGNVNPIIASATAVNVLNNLTIAQGGLFKPTTAPNASYVIETNPAFTNRKNFISSDYFFQQLGVDLTHIPKRLGDGFYEQQLVRNEITALTGKAVLGPYTDIQSMYESLLASGAALSKSLNLPLGMSLSPEQVSQLTSNVILMETRVVGGQSVLVPVVYLAKASQENWNGPLIAANDIDLKNAQSFTNSGTMKAADTLSIDGKQIDNAFGALQSGGLTKLTTTGNIDLTSANVKAGSLLVNTGGDLILDTASKTVKQVSDTGATRVTTTLGPTAKLDVAGNASIVTGGNFQQNAGNLSVGGNLGMNVGGNWDLGAVQTGEHKIVQRANGVSNTDINKVTGSSVTVGGQSNVVVGGDLTAKGAQIDLGKGGTLAAKGNVTLGAASTTSTVNSNSSGSDSHGSYAETLHTSDQVLTGTTLKGGDTVNIVSGKDITLSGSAISLDKGNANLLAAGDVNVGAATETHELNSHETHSHSNVVSGAKIASGIDQTATYSQGSTISADGVTITSGRDVNVTGSNIVGTNDVSLSAARDVNIKTSQDTIQSSTYFDKKETGFMSNGGLSVSVGSRSNSDKQQSSSVTNNGSAIGALNGNLTVSAGNDLHATGSILHAGNDVNLAGKTVKIDAATDTSSFAEQQQFRQAGVTVGVTNPVVAAVQTGRQMTNAAQNVGGDPRLIALAAATTGLAAKNTYDSLKQMGGDPVKAATSVGINVSVGASKSDSQMHAQSSTAVGSTVSAGRNVTIAAAGAGKDSNIDVIGSTISAGNNAKLAAEGNVNLQAAENTSSQHSTNSGSSASVGVSFTVGDKSGIAFTAGVAGNRGNADGDSSTWTNTHVTAGNQLAIQSGGDTNLKGAVVSGKQVVTDVGGNLNIESLQDKDHYDSKQQSAGISASVCAPPLCAGKSSVAGSVGQTKMNSDYASVIEQSGIKAGDGGFQVDVKGNTDLKGGVIASSDKAVQDNLNKLTTGTLTHSDIENHASYDASSVGLSGGYGGTIGKDQKGTADNVNPVPGTSVPSKGGVSVAPPVVIGASGDASSTTKSGVSGGTVTITDGAKQQQLTGETAAEAVANINRDTSNTSSALAPIFDKDKIQAGFDITSQFINQVGTFVDNRLKEADAARAAAKNPNLTPEQRLQAQQQADQLTAEWGPGGTYRQVLSALTAAAGGNVTGGAGQFAQAGVVNYLQQQGASYIGKLVENGTVTEGSPLHAALHAIVGCAGAAASSQSCGAGAMGAAASSLLTNLFAPPTPDMTEQEKEAKQNLISSIVAGVAAESGVGGASGAATTTTSATAAAQNNWLATEQRVQMQKDLVACNGNLGCQLQTNAKWFAASGKQDLLTAGGVWKGLNEAALIDAAGLIRFASDPVAGLKGLQALVEDPQVRAALGDQIVTSLKTRIASMDNALTVGGDANAEQFGRDLGNLVWQTVSVVTAAKGAVGASVTLGRVGLDVTAGALETLARRAPPLVTGAAADMAGTYRFTADQLPTLSNIARNNGQLGEQLSAQLLKEATGQNFVPVQNASGHGVDLVYIDQQTKTIYHVEVKTNYSDLIGKTPTDDLTGRFDKWIDQAVEGRLSGQKLPQDVVDVANQVRTAQKDGYTVSHNVMNVQIPRPGVTESVTAGLRPWPPSP